MISQEMVLEIRRLLALDELSQRKIARLTGVSRATIGAIASGKRPDYEPRPKEDEWERPVGPPLRCPTCGGRVYLPCRLCRIRAQKRRELERKKHLARFIHGGCRQR
jgi:transcriptional regulator with XRE-family HTH domain